MDAEQYPELTFKGTKMTAKGKDQFEVAGELAIRGMTKDVTLPVWNKTLDSGGFLLADEVLVTIAVEAAKKKEAAAK